MRQSVCHFFSFPHVTCHYVFKGCFTHIWCLNACFSSNLGFIKFHCIFFLHLFYLYIFQYFLDQFLELLWTIGRKKNWNRGWRIQDGGHLDCDWLDCKIVALWRTWRNYHVIWRITPCCLLQRKHCTSTINHLCFIIIPWIHVECKAKWAKIANLQM